MHAKKFFICLGALLSSPIWLQSLNAQENIETLQITGSRIAQSVKGSFTTMTRTQIEQINPVSTLDLLRRIPNIVVAENGTGGHSFVALRGGETNFTLVLIDGVAVNDSTNSRGGGFDFSQVNPESIESIEVYRGGISAVYGGEAISGVIHLKTRTSAANVVAMEAGTDQLINGSATFSKQFDSGISLLSSLSSRQRKQSDFAELTSQQALFKVGVNAKTQQHQIFLTFNNTENTSFAEDSGGDLFAIPRQAELRDSKQSLLALSSGFQVSEKLSVSTKLSWLNREEDSIHPGIADGEQSGIPASMIISEFDRKEIEAYLNYQWTKSITLISGLSHRDSEGKNDGELDFGFPLPVDYVLEQQTQSAFLETQYQHTDYSLSFGWRYDDSDNFDSETSLRLAANYIVNDSVRVFAIYNEGYKLPSFFALAHPLVGNAELNPERSENTEVGLTYTDNEQTFSVTLFDNQFTDLVDFDAELFTNVNRNSVDASGIELSLVTPLSDWLNFSADVSYVDVSVDNGPSELRRRPNWFGSASLDAVWNTLSLSIFVDARDSYLDSSIATGLVDLAGYAKYGVSVAWQATSDLTATMNVDNALAKEYQESVGFVQDDANVRIGLRYQF